MPARKSLDAILPPPNKFLPQIFPLDWFCQPRSPEPLETIAQIFTNHAIRGLNSAVREPAGLFQATINQTGSENNPSRIITIELKCTKAIQFIASISVPPEQPTHYVAKFETKYCGFATYSDAQLIDHLKPVNAMIENMAHHMKLTMRELKDPRLATNKAATIAATQGFQHFEPIKAVINALAAEMTYAMNQIAPTNTPKEITTYTIAQTAFYNRTATAQIQFVHPLIPTLQPTALLTIHDKPKGNHRIAELAVLGANRLVMAKFPAAQKDKLANAAKLAWS